MKTQIKKLTSRAFTVLTLSMAYVSSAYAQWSQPGDCPEGAICTGTFRQNMISIINYFLGFLGLLAVLVVIYAGIMMVTAQGDEEQSKKGKTIILWAGIGIVIILLSFTIVNWVIGAGSGVPA